MGFRCLNDSIGPCFCLVAKLGWTLQGKQAIGAVEIFVRADRRCDRTDLRLFERAGLTGNSRMTGVVSTDTVPHRVQ